MPFQFLNNYSTELGVLATSGSSTITITGDGAEFAGASPTHPYALTLSERNIRGVDIRREIVHVTGRSTNTLTVLRGREGTSPDQWPIGTPVEARDTAEGLNESSLAVEVHEGKPDPHTQYEQKANLGSAAYNQSADFEAAGAVSAHEAAGDPHPQYVLELPGAERKQVVISAATSLDLTLVGDFVTIPIPAGFRMYIDHIDLIVTGSDTPGGTPSIVVGPDGVTPDTYLGNSAVSVTALHDREVFTPLVTTGVTEVRVEVNTAGTGTSYLALLLLRGYLMEV